MANIAIFASGSGSNAEQIIRFFKGSEHSVKCVVTNKPTAGVISRADLLGIPVALFSRDQFNLPVNIIKFLKEQEIDLIVLAGFLLKINEEFIQAYPELIINLHPSLLPKYGGKGMYGANVHKAVLAANEKESGITIHIVNEHFDEGRILEQHKVGISDNESVDTLVKKIQQLEHTYLPKAINTYLSGLDR